MLSIPPSTGNESTQPGYAVVDSFIDARTEAPATTPSDRQNPPWFKRELPWSNMMLHTKSTNTIELLVKLETPGVMGRKKVLDDGGRDVVTTPNMAMRQRIRREYGYMTAV